MGLELRIATLKSECVVFKASGLGPRVEGSGYLGASGLHEISRGIAEALVAY